jgi:hypothetical protein
MAASIWSSPLVALPVLPSMHQPLRRFYARGTDTCGCMGGYKTLMASDRHMRVHGRWGERELDIA